MLFPPAIQAANPTRVVITGAGLITALGPGWAINAEGFRAGRVALSPVTLFDVSRHRAKVAGQAELQPVSPILRLNARRIRRLDRATSLLLTAATEAWLQAGWTPSDDLPLVLGTTSGGMGVGEAYYRRAITPPHSTKGQSERVMEYQAQSQAIDLADALGFAGPVTTIANACASGANAIGHAWELIHSGRAERALSGGFDALSHLVFSGFDSLQALSTTQCRPFDANRDGLAIGEGAAVLALESLTRAKQRGANILGELVGYAATTDGHHLTQPHPRGDAAFESMSHACRQARLTPAEIGYINAHGTGTPLNDSAEANAINRWAGPHAKQIPVSSTKSAIGHLLGAAGAVEAVVCLMALREQWLPPTSTTENPDPVCDFPLVRTPTDSALEFAMSNSFGFGGANATLIFRRWV